MSVPELRVGCVVVGRRRVGVELLRRLGDQLLKVCVVVVRPVLRAVLARRPEQVEYQATAWLRNGEPVSGRSARSALSDGQRRSGGRGVRLGDKG